LPCDCGSPGIYQTASGLEIPGMVNRNALSNLVTSLSRRKGHFLYNLCSFANVSDWLLIVIAMSHLEFATYKRMFISSRQGVNFRMCNHYIFDVFKKSLSKVFRDIGDLNSRRYLRLNKYQEFEEGEREKIKNLDMSHVIKLYDSGFNMSVIEVYSMLIGEFDLDETVNCVNRELALLQPISGDTAPCVVLCSKKNEFVIVNETPCADELYLIVEKAI